MYVSPKAAPLGMNIHQRHQRKHRTEIIMEHQSSHNYTIVVQLFLIKREFDTAIPVALEFLP